MEGYLINAACWFAAGLVVGWNVLPQPAWAAKVWKWVRGK